MSAPLNIYAAVYIYKRPVVLRGCLKSIFANTVQPDRIDLIDDCSGEEVETVVMEECESRPNPHAVLDYTIRRENMGASVSFTQSYIQARTLNPRYFFPIEADYIFRPWAFETVVDVFENTPQGQLAWGISGYDHPNFWNNWVKETVFPRGMLAQVGEDNVNRAALHKPFFSGRYMLEFVSNTCPTSYLHWQRITEAAKEFPELWDLLEQVGNPRENPNYPDSATYAQKHITDDGMLSHAISLVWNRWAIKHGINRDKAAAWLNIKPSIAQNITGGGVHSSVKGEMETDGGSPSWT